MKIKELKRENVPTVIVDNTLNRYRNHPAFQSKVDKANEMLRTVGLPKLKK
ncbi:hypothetical protein [Pedobacter psychroterrae]|uniref:hypothetical protein n=1 Tax=Pedobacter psychroterrae TaxID=2530453 RepID=UPI0013F1439C|nr:hypothetical protein [Pedobacter psychroterrae]